MTASPFVVCLHCGAALPPRESGVGGRYRRYCDDLCRSTAKRRRQRYLRVDAPLGLMAARQGALGELIVAADLLRRGFSVYRGVNPDSACDLVVMVGPQAVRFEVTKGWRLTPAHQLCEKTRHRADRYDVLAVWASDGTIRYRPDLQQVEALRQEVAV